MGSADAPVARTGGTKSSAAVVAAYLRHCARSRSRRPCGGIVEHERRVTRTCRRYRAYLGRADGPCDLGYLGVRAAGVGLIESSASSKQIEHGIEAAMIDRVHRFRANFWFRAIGDRNVGLP